MKWDTTTDTRVRVAEVSGKELLEALKAVLPGITDETQVSIKPPGGNSIPLATAIGGGKMQYRKFQVTAVDTKRQTDKPVSPPNQPAAPQAAPAKAQAVAGQKR